MRWIAYAVAAIMLGLIAPPAAVAHDDVVGTSPSNGDQVTQVPEEVRIEFAEQPTSGSGSITGPAGRELRRGTARVDGAELVIPVRSATEPGTYTVEFRVDSPTVTPSAGPSPSSSSPPLRPRCRLLPRTR